MKDATKVVVFDGMRPFIFKADRWYKSSEWLYIEADGSIVAEFPKTFSVWYFSAISND